MADEKLLSIYNKYLPKNNSENDDHTTKSRPFLGSASNIQYDNEDITYNYASTMKTQNSKTKENAEANKTHTSQRMSEHNTIIEEESHEDS